MALVQITDIFDAQVFQDLPAVNSPERTAFFESGVVVRSGLLDSLASGPGKTAELPFWKDLTLTDDPNISTDNPASSATPKNVAQAEQKSRKAMLNQGWSTADLASELATTDPMTHIRSRVDNYWTYQFQRRLIASCRGVLADNVANDSGDMRYNASGATNGDITANTEFTRANFTAAAFTMGDRVDGLSAIAVHSMVYKRMVDNDDIDFIPDSQGRMTIPTFLGKRVIVDDGLPVVAAGGAGAGDTAPFYTSVLFGPGAFGWGDGVPMNPVEIERDAAQGDGGGVETLWTRKSWLLHPFGFAVKNAPAGNSYTLAELALATSWDRVVADRKSAPLAFLVTNG
jgi:hypothetical protein